MISLILVAVIVLSAIVIALLGGASLAFIVADIIVCGSILFGLFKLIVG